MHDTKPYSTNITPKKFAAFFKTYITHLPSFIYALDFLLKTGSVKFKLWSLYQTTGMNLPHFIPDFIFDSSQTY